jgi:hypothetical protein
VLRIQATSTDLSLSNFPPVDEDHVNYCCKLLTTKALTSGDEGLLPKHPILLISAEKLEVSAEVFETRSWGAAEKHVEVSVMLTLENLVILCGRKGLY